MNRTQTTNVASVGLSVQSPHTRRDIMRPGTKLGTKSVFTCGLPAIRRTGAIGGACGHTIMRCAVVMGAALFAATALVSAASVEQTDDQDIDNSVDTTPNETILNLGNPFPPPAGRTAYAVLNWPTSSLNTGDDNFYLDLQTLNGGDGGISVHQMLVDGSESVEFGTTLPIAGTHYDPHPIASIGFNDHASSPDRDTGDISKLVNAWLGGKTPNHGVILVPNGELNTSAGFDFKAEIHLASSERVVGLDSNDLRINTATVGGSQVVHPLNVLEATDDAPIFDSGTPANFFGRDLGTAKVGLDGSQTAYALFKFGLGGVTLGTPSSKLDFTAAGFEIHTVGGSGSVTFDVFEMTTAWDEATVQWDQFGGSGPVAGTDYDATSLGQITMGTTDIQTLDVLDAARNWLQNPSQNFGLILVPVSGETDHVFISTSERVPVGLDGDDTRLLLTIVPEPSTLGLGALGILGLLNRRRTGGEGRRARGEGRGPG